MSKERPMLKGTIMTPLNHMRLIRCMNTLLSKQHDAVFVPPDRLITKEEFYAQKNSAAPPVSSD